MRRLACLVVALLLAGAARAAETRAASDQLAAPAVTVRVGDHRGFGRIVYEFAAATAYSLSAEPGRVRLEIPGLPALPTPEHLPRNVRAIRAAGSALEFDLAQGARARVTRLGERVIVDLLDPPRSASSRPVPQRPVPQRADRDSPPIPPAAKPATNPPSPVAQPAAAAPPPATPAPKPLPAVEPPPAPVPVIATPVAEPVHQAPGKVVEQLSLPPSSPESAGPISVAAVPLPASEEGAILPFPKKVGAAAFRRGSLAFLVFDTRQPLDLAQLTDDPLLGHAKVELLPAATLVSFPLPDNASLRLDRVREGWRVRAGDSENSTAQSTHQADGEIVFGLADPSQAVVVPDPESRATLLIGTVRPGSGPGTAVDVARRTPSFRVVPAWLGLVVESLSDRVQLNARADGFVLRVPDPMLAPEVAASAALADAAALTRSFDFPDLPTAALLRRMEASVAAAAAAPPRARLSARIAAAQAMIALGLGAEAQGLLEAARAAEPRSPQDDHAAALEAVASLVDGHPEGATSLDTSQLGGSDELTLWRAIGVASQASAVNEPSPAAAAALATTLPLLLAYPEALREKLLPLIAETLALGGQEKATGALLEQFPSDPALSLARGLHLEASGATIKALALYDQLTTDRDRLVRVRAGVRAAELRHRTGELTAAATADALDRLLIAWRGDQRELALRLRVAELREQAGQFRPALELLRGTQTLFPAARENIKDRMGRTFQALIAGDQAGALKPLDFIALAADFADCVPSGEAGDRLAELLAGRLVALDLPDQAVPVLERLMRAAPVGAPRARFGLQLAKMRLEGSDPTAALAALRASDSPDLPPPLSEERGLALARTQVAQGDLPGALSTLAALGTAPADERRAALLEGAKDWPGALAALRDLAAKRVAATGPLAPEQQEIVLREASAALQAGNQDALAALRDAAEARMGNGPRADLFRLLTDRPIQSPSDLPRAARDVALARGMSQGLQSLSAR